MQDYLKSFGTGSAGNYLNSLPKNTSTTQYLSSLNKKKLPTSLSGPQSLVPTSTPKPTAPTSNVGATGTTGTPSPAKSAYIQSLSSSPVTNPISNTPSALLPNVNPNAGMYGQPPVSTPTSNANNAYTEAYTKYIQSLAPSEEETRASRTLSALSLQAEKDQEEALGRGETLGFAAGEAARVNKNNSFGIRAASDALNALTGARTASSNAAKARVDFEKGLISDQSESANTKFEQDLATKKFEQDRIAIDRKFEEDKRQFGMEYALKQKNLALDQYKTYTSGTKADNPTVDESKARQFAASASQADNILNSLGYNPGLLELPLPNQVKSGARQQFEQAARAFVNSVLRRESGATITDDEFNNKYKELIPQAGDSSGVKEQKKLARQTAVASITAAGGNFTPPSQTTAAPSSGVTSSGIKYTILQ